VAAKLTLRRFLYLDSALVDEFLAPVEGGIFLAEEQSSAAKKARGLGGGVAGGGFAARAEKSSGEESGVSRTLVQTPESAFSRLITLLEEAEALQPLEAFDEAIWDQLERGEIIEAECRVAVSPLVRYADLVQQLGPLLQMMEALGEEIDPETQTAMAGLNLLGQIAGKVPVIARASGSPKFKFVASLEPDKLRVHLDELEGESTMLAKIQRKLAKSEKLTVLDSIPGLSGLPREARREIERGLKNDKTMADAVITAPAAVVTPIAAYR
jgi:hypothetical protein